MLADFAPLVGAGALPGRGLFYAGIRVGGRAAHGGHGGRLVLGVGLRVARVLDDVRPSLVGSMMSSHMKASSNALLLVLHLVVKRPQSRGAPVDGCK